MFLSFFFVLKLLKQCLILHKFKKLIIHIHFLKVILKLKF